ncbi:MAG TPA: J domain-containing protein [Vicinamibacterales bacterium]|nr:J domain-containing protein [Vicinamibacterales bacterium]
MDFYIVLGVQREATTSDIKRAYRRLARRFHPDINPGDREAVARFRQIVDAYETLMDPDRRHRYDSGKIGGADDDDDAESFGFAGFDFSGSAAGYQATTFGELFEDVFARRGERDRPSDTTRGADLHLRASLSFDEAWHGIDWPVTLTRQDACRTCAGSGYHRTVESRCVSCEGSGIVRSVRGHMVFSKNCAHCGGSGRLRQLACETCQGQGVETRSEALTVKIPAGVAAGTRVRVPAKGHAGVRGAPPGDLYIDVEVRPHPMYWREGDDLHTVVPIAIHEAALGAKIALAIPDGAVRLRVPPGTQSGQRFRLRERGAPAARHGGRGDLVIEVRLMLPKLLDERSKELLREFGRINGESVRE